MASTSITIRIDENLKKQAEAIFDDMGLNMTTAFTVFTKAVVRQGKIPFELATDLFYSSENQSRLLKTIQNADKAPVIIKTMQELEEMEI